MAKFDAQTKLMPIIVDGCPATIEAVFQYDDVKQVWYLDDFWLKAPIPTGLEDQLTADDWKLIGESLYDASRQSLQIDHETEDES